MIPPRSGRPAIPAHRAGDGQPRRQVSLQKLQANRANAQRSTGPQSDAGKARSSRNACRHGLAVPLRSDPRLAADAEALAREIAGEAAPATLVALARQVAEAQIQLVRVQRVRHEVWTARLAQPDVWASTTVTGSERNLGLELAKLAHYERRAQSRRKAAIRAFDAAGIGFEENNPNGRSNSDRAGVRPVLAERTQPSVRGDGTTARRLMGRQSTPLKPGRRLAVMPIDGVWPRPGSAPTRFLAERTQCRPEIEGQAGFGKTNPLPRAAAVASMNPRFWRVELCATSIRSGASAG